MKFFRTIILFVVILAGYSSRVDGQLYFPEDMVKVSGQLVDEITGENIRYAQVVNMRVHGGTMTDVNGKFSIQADPSDTLTFKLLGYKDKTIPVKEILAKNIENFKIPFSPIRFLIDQVEVKSDPLKVNMTGIPQGKTSTIPIELRSDDFNSKPGLLTSIFNPFSYLHYQLSSSEKEKRSTLAAIHSERQWQILSLIYNKDVIQRITFLTGEKLDDFMVYCNAFNGLGANSTTYDVEKRIKDLLIEYNKLYPQKK